MPRERNVGRRIIRPRSPAGPRLPEEADARQRRAFASSGFSLPKCEREGKRQMGRKMDRLNECGPFQIRSSVVKNGSLPGHWLAGTCPPSCRPWRPESARWSAATSDSGTDPAHFLSPFQSCCRSWRCPVRPKACWRRENSSGQSQRVLWNVRQGCCSAPAVRPPVHGSDTATVPSDSIRLCPAQILAQRWLFLPMPTKRPSRAWTVPDAAYIVLRVAVLLIPAQ